MEIATTLFATMMPHSHIVLRLKNVGWVGFENMKITTNASQLATTETSHDGEPTLGVVAQPKVG